MWMLPVIPITAITISPPISSPSVISWNLCDGWSIVSHGVEPGYPGAGGNLDMCLLADSVGSVSCIGNYTHAGRKVSGILSSISASDLSGIALGVLFMTRLAIV